MLAWTQMVEMEMEWSGQIQDKYRREKLMGRVKDLDVRDKGQNEEGSVLCLE